MDIKMKNCKIKTSFVCPDGPKALADNTGINFTISILIFVKNCLYFDAVHDFSVGLIVGSNPENINRFQSFTRKYILYFSNPANVSSQSGTGQ